MFSKAHWFSDWCMIQKAWKASNSPSVDLAQIFFITTLKVDGTSFSDAGSLVTTAHLTCEICPRDLKYRKGKTNMGAQKLLLTRCFFNVCTRLDQNKSCPLGVSCWAIQYALEKHFLQFNARNSKLEFRSVWRSILSAIAISNNLKTTSFHHTDRP